LIIGPHVISTYFTSNIHQNGIEILGVKQKHRNCMIITILKSIMRVAMEGPAKDFESILMDAIVMKKNATKSWYLFTNLEKYLIGTTEESLQ
jgi:hypothetical protein